jgi:hypothetical protein
MSFLFFISHLKEERRERREREDREEKEERERDREERAHSWDTLGTMRNNVSPGVPRTRKKEEKMSLMFAVSLYF